MQFMGPPKQVTGSSLWAGQEWPHLLLCGLLLLGLGKTEVWPVLEWCPTPPGERLAHVVMGLAKPSWTSPGYRLQVPSAGTRTGDCLLTWASGPDTKHTRQVALSGRIENAQLDVNFKHTVSEFF